MTEPSTTTAATPNTSANAFTIENCPECEQFTGARLAWCLGGNGDIARANRWRRGQRLPPLQTYAASQEDWSPDMPSRGLGDVVAKITHATGIDRIVKAATGGGCGCKARQAALNAAVPFKTQ